MSFSSRLMSKRLDSFQMTFYTGGVAYLALLPLAVHYEASAALARTHACSRMRACHVHSMHGMYVHACMHV